MWHPEHARNRFHRVLGMRGTHAQPAVKCEQFLHVQSMLGMRGNVLKSNISAESDTIFKNLLLLALGTVRFRFLQRGSKGKFHACVPLNSPNQLL